MATRTRRLSRHAATPLAAVLLLGLVISGCTIHAAPAPHRHSAAPVRVTVAAGHAHTVRCGHFRHRGHWYHLRGHIHGRACGHVRVGGIWVVRR